MVDMEQKLNNCKKKRQKKRVRQFSALMFISKYFWIATSTNGLFQIIASMLCKTMPYTHITSNGISRVRKQNSRKRLFTMR